MGSRKFWGHPTFQISLSFFSFSLSFQFVNHYNEEENG